MVHNFNPAQFKGQFILTTDNKDIAEWNCNTFNEWKLFTAYLPVINVVTKENRWLGWCIGHPIVDGILHPESIVLNSTSESSIEEFYHRATGKWALFLLGADIQNIYLDAYGSLSIVYSIKEKSLASTPTLLGTNKDWDEDLMKDLGFPEKISWLPFGLTFKKNIFRLLPNHKLNVKTWDIKRHWPTSDTDLSINKDVIVPVQQIIDSVKRSINAISAKYPICLTLTAGRDSRSVLACAHDHIEDMTVITFAQEKETVEMFTAGKIAKQNQLHHKFLKITSATPEELENWLFKTGYSVSGAIWKIHKTLEQLDNSKVLLPGTSAELHKGNYWVINDLKNPNFKAEELLKRAKLPTHNLLVEAASSWIKNLRYLNSINILDLFHIEQRLACWAAPAFYGNTTSKFEVAVFNNRQIAKNMMRLPLEYRQRKQLTTDLCKQQWPELLNIPFNQAPGILALFKSKLKTIKKALKN